MSYRKTSSDDTGRAGARDQKIWFQVETELSPPQNTLGKPMTEWTDSFYAWACVQWVGSREFPAANKLHEETTTRFRILNTDGISAATQRIRYQGKRWNIYPPVPVNRQTELEIEAHFMEGIEQTD